MSKLSDVVDRKIGRDQIDKMAAALLARGVEPEQIGQVTRVSMWQTVTKNADNEAETHDLFGFQLAPSWDSGPEWPVVQPGAAVKVSGRKTTRRSAGAKDTVVVLPDMQVGFYHDLQGELVPTHDPDAINAALAVVAELDPGRVVMLGDNLDLPEFGKYRITPAFANTTQATLDAMVDIIARLRHAAPNAQIEWLAGNHEERLTNAIIDNAKAAFGLRPGGTAPTSWPVLSVPHLCRLDDYDVSFVPGYPAGEVWLCDTLKIIHGDTVKSRGSTAHVYLSKEKVSVIYGHIHRIEEAHQTRDDHNGPAEIMAASPGCLAKITGGVPSTKGGLDLHGRPLQRTEDWQQGVGIVTLHGDRWAYECARIDRGTAYFRGQAITAE